MQRKNSINLANANIRQYTVPQCTISMTQSRLSILKGTFTTQQCKSV